MQTTPNPGKEVICLECQVQVSWECLDEEHNEHKPFIRMTKFTSNAQTQIDEIY